MIHNISLSDILIIGDSFCAHREFPDGWPLLVARQLAELKDNTTSLLENQTRGKGHAGASWWSTRATLYKELQIKVPKILILVHTEPLRLPSDYDFPLNYTSAYEYEDMMEGVNRTFYYYNKNGPEFNLTAPEFTNKPLSRPILDQSVFRAAAKFYENINCVPFLLWSNIKWFEELDALIMKHNIPIVVHLHAFSSPDYKYFSIPDSDNYVFKTGITVEQTLISLSELDNNMKIIENRNVNHFSRTGNIKLASALYQLITKYTNADAGTKKRLEW